MDIAILTGFVAALFIIIGLGEPLAARLRLPFTVILAGIGVVLGLVAGLLPTLELPAALAPITQIIGEVPIRADTFLFVFLPTLLFQVALGLNLRRMADDWMPILVLAVLAVVVSTFAIGYALYQVAALSLVACLLIGAIVSTTDPSAVVSLFRNIAAPQRLTRIVEGESLLNDAAAIALFALFLNIMLPSRPSPGALEALLQLPVLFVGGAAIGWLVARVLIWLIRVIATHPLSQVSLSVAIPYVAYVLAERAIGASGVIAVVVAGMTLNLMGPARIPPVAWGYLREVWDLLAHWAGALVFVLAALLIPQLLGAAKPGDLLLLGVVIAAAVAARVAILFGVMPILTALRLSPRIDAPYRVAILWGGLRGAVTLALALAVTENPAVPTEVKRLVGILATGFVLFTLIVQGTTLRMMLRLLGLDRLSPLDGALSKQVIAVALQNVREDVAELTSRNELPREVTRSEAKRFAERLDKAIQETEDDTRIQDRDRITLGLIALAGRERDLILENFRQQLISMRQVEAMLSDVDRLIERTRSGGRTEYRRAGREALGRGRLFTLAVWLNNRLRISGPLAAQAADRFEILLYQRQILRELHGYLDSKIVRVHGRRVAELLHELLDRRMSDTENAIEGLRLQYPGYAEQLERQFIRRTALRLEEREYDQLRDDGLIGPELHATLTARLARMRADADIRPPLDLALQKSELVSRLELFKSLSKVQQRRLARALKAIYPAPGDVLIRKGETARSIFFIASGAVEVDAAGQRTRLGRGDMFGQLAVLARHRRRAQVTALTHSTILVLDETRFKRLLESSPELRAVVRDSARVRGVTLPRGTLPQRRDRPEAG